LPLFSRQRTSTQRGKAVDRGAPGGGPPAMVQSAQWIIRPCHPRCLVV